MAGGCEGQGCRLEDVEVLVDVGEERRVGRGIGRHQKGGPEGEGARERDALPRREGELEAAAHDDLSRVRAHHRRRLARGEQPDGPHVERSRPEARLERVPLGEKAELAAHALSSARPVAVVRGDGRIGRARRQARLRPVGLRGARGVKEARVVGGDHGEVDVEGEEQRERRLDPRVPDRLVDAARRRARHAARQHHPRVQKEVVRHDDGADRPDGLRDGVALQAG
mmetsp:Transcript_18051/g.59453  ORF Transcript_18051/g.59453 Transcript_18051/m.59453 type:complete len:226 (+) Transcript_18051:557-1234(+)